MAVTALPARSARTWSGRSDEAWRGWWGEDPPFGHDVFVLTHHPRPDLAMRNGTTFRFLDASPHEALARAAEAAGGKDVVLGGGVATVRAFVAAGLVDELHVAVAPVLLGGGERALRRTSRDHPLCLLPPGVLGWRRSPPSAAGEAGGGAAAGT